jgi:bifunctional non-homologous end joining protein LigD
VQKGIRQKPLRNVARFIAPMKPTMVPKLPDDRAKWLLEPKLDGYRVVAVKSAGRANIYSIDAKPYNKEFPAIYDAVSALFVKDVVLDGEILAVESTGKPNFNALQNRRSTKLPIYYVVFDCLHFKGRDLLDKPIEERKKYLAEIAAGFVSPLQPIFEFGPDVDLATATSAVKQAKIEGLVAKRLGSHYHPGGESDVWLKQRFNQEDTFFIGGYLPGEKGLANC